MRVLVVVATTVVVSAGCGSHRATSPSVRRSSLAAIASGLERIARAGRFSGTVLVARNGRPVLIRAYGFANRTSHERNGPDTRFNLASVGKTFTAVAVGRLVQEGKLHFEDPIGRYLPELPRRLGDRITVGELLDHTSGLGDFFASADYERLRPTLISLDRYLPLIVGAPPVDAPGNAFHYSNSGYILLGLIVERVSGLDYYKVLQREVFARAGMARSGCFRSNRLGRGKSDRASQGRVATAADAEAAQGPGLLTGLVACRQASPAVRTVQQRSARARPRSASARLLFPALRSASGDAP